MLNNIYEIISLWVLSHSILVSYLMGSLVAIGIVYTLTSSNCLKPSDRDRRKTYIISAISSWIVVLMFLYGFLRGFLKVLFGKNNNEGGN